VVDIHLKTRGPVGELAPRRVDTADFTPLEEDVVSPASQEVDADAIGHYCGLACLRLHRLIASVGAIRPRPQHKCAGRE
jgi:hypothetical protein